MGCQRWRWAVASARAGAVEPSYLLARRSRLVDEGGTWGIPGGAIRNGESPEAAARREIAEEIGELPAYRLAGVEVQDCGGGWLFHILTADVEEPFEAYSVQETDATDWFTEDEMNNLALHSGSGAGSTSTPARTRTANDDRAQHQWWLGICGGNAKRLPQTRSRRRASRRP